VIPGERSNALVHLDAGDYVLLSWAPDKDGVPQFRHGMVELLSVVDSNAEVDDLEMTLTLDLIDFSWVCSKSVEKAKRQSCRHS
jgi:hypothetical protein